MRIPMIVKKIRKFPTDSPILPIGYDGIWSMNYDGPAVTEYLSKNKEANRSIGLRELMDSFWSYGHYVFNEDTKQYHWKEIPDEKQ